MSGSKWSVVTAVLTVGVCLGCSGLLWAVKSPSFLGMDQDEDDYSPREQRKLLDKFSPVPVPASASDLRIRYQGFQDSSMRISFTLPPGDFESYVAGLTPHPDLPGSYVGRTQLEDGGSVADSSSITVDPATRCVKLHAFTW